MTAITASIRKAQRVAIDAGGFNLRGVIYGDTKGRYRDGWFFYTAKVVAEIEPNVFRTATGNVYQVETWSAPSKPTNEYDPLPADWPYCASAE
ncbi:MULTISPECIES: hypothetical protein [unclassified Bradyrhizobium]|uniref:hypothetical protein n=2 Tax=Bradyrhizobium TaxID=374 RepID=UPI002916766E|nr:MULTISPECIES: hypothetical protein [unclassified Bradyrhizobium]